MTSHDESMFKDIALPRKPGFLYFFQKTPCQINITILDASTTFPSMMFWSHLVNPPILFDEGKITFSRTKFFSRISAFVSRNLMTTLFTNKSFLMGSRSFLSRPTHNITTVSYRGILFSKDELNNRRREEIG